MNMRITKSPLALMFVSMAAVTKDHNHSGLDTQLFLHILEVRSLTLVSLEEQQGSLLSGGLGVGDLFLALFQLLKSPASLGLWPLPFKASTASP